jgi:hypothetical protein
MSAYLSGVQVLGAGQFSAGQSSAPITPVERDKAIQTLVPYTIFGMIAGALAGALLWRSHRVLGGGIGGLLVGPLIGTGVGVAQAAKELEADRRMAGTWRTG